MTNYQATYKVRVDGDESIHRSVQEIIADNRKSAESQAKSYLKDMMKASIFSKGSVLEKLVEIKEDRKAAELTDKHYRG